MKSSSVVCFREKARCRNVTTLTRAASGLDQSETLELCAPAVGGVTSVGAARSSHSWTFGDRNIDIATETAAP